jgi:crotonobetainyl-CoA:carnitine CoA-transferase CaiB-like acyl-CoA transferase
MSTTELSSNTALDGTVVLDLTDTRGGMAGRILADLGADVIHVEPPGGCALRRSAPFRNGREGDPDGSLAWSAFSLGKRSVVLDRERNDDRDRLRRLIAAADVLIEADAPGALARYGLDYPTLARSHPDLIYASITAFGQTGPLAHAPSSDLTLLAAGGLLGLQGDVDRPPIPLGLPQAWCHAGAQAAADILIALNERARSGLGQHLDVAVQAAVVWTLMNATGYPPNTGANPPGTSEFRTMPPPQFVPGLEIPRTLPCRDGWVVVGWALPGVGERTFAELAAWAAEVCPLPVPLAYAELATWRERVLNGTMTVASFNAVGRAIAQQIAAHSKAELQRLAVERKLLVAAVYDVHDLLADVQLESREYWRDVGGTIFPGPFAKLSATPIVMSRGAPRLDADRNHAPAKRPPMRREHAPTDSALSGLRVLDLAWVGVGPMISKALADHGATVVHVESRRRIDVLRLLPPFKDNLPGQDRSQFFANFNTSKLGIELDFANADELAEVRALAQWADVIVESFTPGTLTRYGLDYASLSRMRPDLVMLSTCMRGQTGPERGYGGFGNQGAALAGLIAITGWPDRPPAGPWGAYTDFVAPRYGVAALAAAVLFRHRTERGQHIDLSQIEAAIHFQEPLVLDYTVNGRVAKPRGLDDPDARVHGVYRARDPERYVAVTAHDATQYAALIGVTGHHDLAQWCAERDPFDGARELREAGVPACAVLRPSDLYADPQLAHRGFFVTLDHPVMGPTPHDGPVTRFSRTPARLRSPAPCLGQHADAIRELLAQSELAISLTR